MFMLATLAIYLIQLTAFETGDEVKYSIILKIHLKSI